MGLTTGNLPPVDPVAFMREPYRERTKALARHWVDYGWGAPALIPLIYVAKLLVLSVFCGVVVATTTSGLDPFSPSEWWSEPIVYQKLVLWTLLLESIGVAGSWGPLAGHYKPMTVGFRHYSRPRTIRLPPWPDRVPLTRGDERTPLDAALYVAYIAGVITCLVIGSVHSTSATNAIGHNAGLVAPAAIIPVLALLLVLGLRDKVVFLAARGEQYVPALVFFAFFPFVDMIVAAKVLIVVVWVGASFSKFGRHFASVIPPMVSNTPWLFVKAIKRFHYRSFPEDLRPSERAVGLAHGAGTLVEFVMPFVLLFSHDHTLTVIAVVAMIGFHLFIISTFPLAVPLEWNALFMYLAAFLFLGHPNQSGYGLGDMDAGLLAATVAALLFFPVLGNLRPDLVSFLPAMRQYAGNWATAMWALAPDAEEKLDQRIVKAARVQKKQLVELGLYTPEEANVVLAMPLAWRALHSQGRGLNSVMMNQLDDDIDTYTLREGELCCNLLVGFNFGDGHLHDRRMLEAVQRRCEFEPGELVVVWSESEPIGSGRQQYWVMDAAVGIVERGSWAVRDAIAEQAWLPNGPITTKVTYRREGYERVRYSGSDVAPAPTPAAEPQELTV